MRLLNKYFDNLIQGNPFYSFCNTNFVADKKKYICNLMKNHNYFQRFYLCCESKYHNNKVFRWACGNGHLETAKWLIKTFPKINVHTDNDCAFRWTCEGGHLEMAKWLIKTFPRVNVHAYNDYAFRWACMCRHLETARWLTTICSNYVITQESPEILYEIKN